MPVPRGFKHSKESKMKMSLKRKGTLNFMYGKSHTPEARARISAAQKGKKESMEFCEKTRLRRLGQKHTEQTRKRISDALTGKKHSAEHRKHNSESKIGVRAGSESPHWRGGVSNFPYPFKFNKALKERIKRRDGRVCKMVGCGMTEYESVHNYKMPLTVHHIDYNKDNCADDNLITLCTGCNSKVNFNRACWQDLFIRTLAFTPMTLIDGGLPIHLQ